MTRKWVEDCYKERKKLPWRRYALDKADKGPESEEEICEQDDNLVETSTTQPVREIDSEDETLVFVDLHFCEVIWKFLGELKVQILMRKSLKYSVNKRNPKVETYFLWTLMMKILLLLITV